jgi:CxxC-x17-CxxC domain-containing protein
MLYKRRCERWRKRVRSDFCTATVKELRELTYERKEMTKAVCAECGKECEVPFKPDGSRPVYCRECYAKRAPPRRSRY